MTMIQQQMRRLLTLSGRGADPLLFCDRVQPGAMTGAFTHQARWYTPLVEKVIAWCDWQLFFL